MKGILVTLIAIIVGIAVGAYVTPRLSTPTDPSVPKPTPTSVIRSGPTVIQAIQTQSKLATVVMNITQDKTISRSHGIGGVCSEEITYLGYFNVTAGIDLAKITRENILVENDGQPDLAKVTITLPQPEILGNELDTKNSRIVAQQTPKWVPGCSHQIADMTIEAQQKIQSSVADAAREKGILHLAEEKAGFELERMLLNAGYKNVTIRYTTT